MHVRYSSAVVGYTLRKDKSMEITLILHHETEKAYIVSETENSPKHWIPKSQCKYEDIKHDKITLEIPEWLMERCGFI